MTPRAWGALERLDTAGLQCVEDLLEDLAERIELLRAGAKVGRGSETIVIEIPVSRGRPLKPRFVERKLVGRT